MTIHTPPYDEEVEEKPDEKPSEEAAESTEETEAEKPEDPPATEPDPEPDPEEDTPDDDEEEEISLEDWYKNTNIEFDEMRSNLKKKQDEISKLKDDIKEDRLKLDGEKKDHEKYVTQRNQQVSELAKDRGVGEDFKDLKDTERKARDELGRISSHWKKKDYFDENTMVRDPNMKGGQRKATPVEIKNMNARANVKENERLLELEDMLVGVVKASFPGITEVLNIVKAQEVAAPWIKTSKKFREANGIGDKDPVMAAVSKDIYEKGHVNEKHSEESMMFIVEGTYNRIKAGNGVGNKPAPGGVKAKPLPKGAKKFKIKRKSPPKQVGNAGGTSGTVRAPTKNKGRPLTPREWKDS